MSVKIRCPFCGLKAELDDFVEGAQVECPQCKRVFTLGMSVMDSEQASSSEDIKSVQENKSIDANEKAEAVEKTEEKKQKESSEGEKDDNALVHISEIASSSTTSEIKILKVLLIVMVIIMGIMCILMMNMNAKLDAMSPKDNPITDCRLINYTWEYPALMQGEFDDAIRAGYEPAGYVCQNSIKGGFFLFVKRKK